MDLQELTSQAFIATKKDFIRAEGMYWSGHTFGQPLVKTNAAKMAKLIKDKKKILQRFEAVVKVWGYDVSKPFAEKIRELHPNSEYSGAYASGLHDGRYSMSPSRGPQSDNEIINLMYWQGYHDSGRQ